MYIYNTHRGLIGLQGRPYVRPSSLNVISLFIYLINPLTKCHLKRFHFLYHKIKRTYKHIVTVLFAYKEKILCLKIYLSSYFITYSYFVNISPVYNFLEKNYLRITNCRPTAGSLAIIKSNMKKYHCF